LPDNSSRIAAYPDFLPRKITVAARLDGVGNPPAVTFSRFNDLTLN
jgi:hypothetical protein